MRGGNFNVKLEQVILSVLIYPPLLGWPLKEKGRVNRRGWKSEVEEAKLKVGVKTCNNCLQVLKLEMERFTGRAELAAECRASSRQNKRRVKINRQAISHILVPHDAECQLRPAVEVADRITQAVVRRVGELCSNA
jgi:hypothetical protein